MPVSESPSKLVPMLLRALYAIVLLSLSSLYAQSAAETSRTEIVRDSARITYPEALSPETACKADPSFSEKRMYREISPGLESRTGVVICSQAEKVIAGETAYTARGTQLHEVFANARREAGIYNTVDSALLDAAGNPITVPRRVNVLTGEVRPSYSAKPKPMSVRPEPDATFNKAGTIIEDKPIGRDIMKDRQQLIQYITAYKKSTGTLPRQIGVTRYDRATGLQMHSELHSPKRFAPWLYE